MHMSRHLSRSILIGLLALTLGPGCYGKNVCFNAVTKWHADLTWNKWAKEAFFIPIYILVIPITGLIDFFIVNPIGFFSEDDGMYTGLLPAPSGEMHCFVWNGSRYEVATWFMTDDPGTAVLESGAGCTIAEVRRLEDGALVLTDLGTGEERPIDAEELATPLWR